MVAAKWMTAEQKEALLKVAQADKALWNAFKDREINPDNEDGSEKWPNLAKLIVDFADRELGPNHGYDVVSLLMRIRAETRRELGLEV